MTPSIRPCEAKIADGENSFLETAIPLQKRLVALKDAAEHGALSAAGIDELRRIATSVSAAPAAPETLSNAAKHVIRAARSGGAAAIAEAIANLTSEWRKARRPVALSPRSGIEPPPKSNALVLIVEDDPSTRMTMELLLSPFARVASAESVEDALSEINRCAPALIIIDNQLRGAGTGIDLVEKIRRAPATRNTPVVMATGTEAHEDAVRAIVAGVSDYVQKPISPVLFQEKIRALLEANTHTVLIADGDETTREILARRFRASGVKTIEAETVAEALELAAKTRPSLVIADRIMPHGDGIGLLYAFKQNPALRETPVVFLTSRCDEEDVLESLRAGAADHLAKPFNRDIVFARCARFLLKTGAA